MESQTWIFSETSVPAVVARLRRQWPGRRRPLTLDGLSKVLGYKSPRLIAMIEKGQRAPSPEFIERLGEKAGFTTTEQEYLRLLTRPKEERLDELRKRHRTPAIISNDIFRMMSEWQHLVLMQLFAVVRPYDAAKVRARLKRDLSVAQIEDSLKLLLDLGILKPDGDGFAVSQSGLQFTQDNMPSKAKQNHHAEMMERSRDAMKTDLMADRDFKSYTFRANPDRIDEMKRDLVEFIMVMSSKYWDDDAQDVFQLNLQLFKHTRPGDRS